MEEKHIPVYEEDTIKIYEAKELAQLDGCTTANVYRWLQINHIPKINNRIYNITENVKRMFLDRRNK